MKKKTEILIIDDERNTREGLKRALTPNYHVTLASDAQNGLDLVLERRFDVILTDLRMPGMDGINFIHRISTMDNPPVCIMFTAYGSVENAVEAMKAGAYDYLTKPVNLDNLEIIIKRALESRLLKRENRDLKRELASKYALENLIGKSMAMQRVFDTLKQIAPARSTALLTGESGTGKELAARALHQLSNRADKPFVTVHCAALSRNLLESELFGHEKGAFTGATERRIGRFEAADGGTIFLDEITEIDPSVQIVLLRILENRTFERVGGAEPIEVDVRLIAATNTDLKQLVDNGDFREDLYYRLDVLNIRMPPLRERREDIPLMLKHYLDIFNKENDRHVNSFTPETVEILTAYSWPGNVRELRNCIERMVVLARNDDITLSDIPQQIRNETADMVSRPRISLVAKDAPLDIDANERRLIVQALHECSGNRSAAAKKLGISRRTIIRKLKKYGV
jgi:two-component system, NtrC family, response regulator AtoC